MLQANNLHNSRIVAMPVIGGSSGLGLELAHLLEEDYETFVTGRHDPNQDHINFITLELGTGDIAGNLEKCIAALPNIDLLIYAAGFYQEGKIDELTDEAIGSMENVGLHAPALLIQRLLKKQKALNGFIAITSTSQWTPRLLEPMYTAVKAGLAMFANSLSLDPRVGKVLVAGPAGMKTRFWDNNTRDTSTMLDPKWVAEEVFKLYKGDFKYKFARIMRDPPRVEVVETR